MEQRPLISMAVVLVDTGAWRGGDEVPPLGLELEGKQKYESLEFGGIKLLTCISFSSSAKLGCKCIYGHTVMRTHCQTLNTWVPELSKGSTPHTLESKQSVYLSPLGISCKQIYICLLVANLFSPT